MTEGQFDSDATRAIVAAPQGASAPTGPRVAVLGSGEGAAELVRALSNLGAQVAVAADPAALPELFGGLPADVVVPSVRALELTSDVKQIRRRAAEELGLPTAPYWFAESVAELRAAAGRAGYPLLVKAGGRGVLVSAPDGPQGVDAAWQRVAGPAGGWLMAETVVAVDTLVTMIAVVGDGPRGIAIDFCAPIGHRLNADGSQEAWQPLKLSAAALDVGKSIVARIVKAIGERGVFAVELLVNGDEVYFADITVALPESTWVTVRTQRLSAFELQARVALGLTADTMMVSPGAALVVSAPPPTARLAAVLEVPETDIRTFAGGGRRTGVILATGLDVDTSREQIREVVRRRGMPDSAT